MQSKFHRVNEFCGSCHDVSNSAVGDLAHNNGAQTTADPVISSGIPGSLVETKAAFNNFPFMYGIVERTFSEFMSSAYSKQPMTDLNLPADLLSGAILAAYESALASGPAGPDYADGTTRFINCQTCHLRPVTGFGCNKKGAPVRTDLPLHDMTGGNYWMPDAIQYLDLQGKLLLGGGLTSTQVTALNDGKIRVLKQLSEAATLSIDGNTLKIVNHTGHKLISGYPEGRRMWLNIKWYDGDNALLREDGKYGAIGVTVNHPFDGAPYNVESIIDLHDPNTRIYEAHYAMTQEWANQLITLGYPSSLPLSYDRLTGGDDFNLGELAAQSPGIYHETFHFVLNNKVAKDNRIPPYGMQYEEARKRNALPVPADQFGSPGPGGTFDYFDQVSLNPPAGAEYAQIDLLYQPTSWEYIQFLWKANTGNNSFLADEGVNLLAARLGTGMAYPYVMASTTWGTAPTPPTPEIIVSTLETWSVGRKGVFETPSDTFKPGQTVGIRSVVTDETSQLLSGAQVFMEIRDQGGNTVTSLQGFSDTNGIADLTWKTSRREGPGTYTATVTNVIKSGYEFIGSSPNVSFTIQ